MQLQTKRRCGGGVLRRTEIAMSSLVVNLEWSGSIVIRCHFLFYKERINFLPIGKTILFICIKKTKQLHHHGN